MNTKQNNTYTKRFAGKNAQQRIIRLWIPAISILILVVCLALSFHIRAFNSDDVAWQNALISWRPFQGHTLYWSPDTWVLKIPIYLIVEHIFGLTRRAVFVEAAIFSVANFILFYYSAVYFLKKITGKVEPISVIPLVWLASFGFTFTRLFLNTNLRSIEIGLSFLLFMLVVKLYNRDFDNLRFAWKIFITVITCLSIGLLIYNDPYFLYFTVIPITIYSAVIFFTNPYYRKLVIFFMAAILTSLISWKIFSKVGSIAGIKILPQQVMFVSFDHLFAQIALSIQSILMVFGADFTGRAALNIVTIGFLANLSLLLIVISAIWRQAKFNLSDMKNRISEAQLWKSFFSFTPVFIIIIYCLSSIATANTYRYLVLLPFFAVIILCIRISEASEYVQKVITFIVLSGVLINIGTCFVMEFRPSIVGEGVNKANSQNYELISILSKNSLKKGYSQYWEGNINSYLSMGSVNILPTVCLNGMEQQFTWMINSALYQSHVKRSFYVIEDDPAASTPQCELDKLRIQFGAPQQVLLTSNTMILVYNYDIGTKLLPGTLFGK